MRPFLKWAGGKYQIIERIRQLLPKGKRLIEPFVGSGAVFLNTDFPRYLLADNNADLINIFKYMKKERQDFIDYSATFFGPRKNTESVFLRNREIFNTTDDLRLKAALFLYLNKHTFNGLMRYNSSGKFNVSFGRYKKPYFPEKEMLFFIKKIRKASIRYADFLFTMNQAQPGDVVYCDPPYIPLSHTANFTKYGAAGFGLSAQKALVSMAKKLTQRGVVVIISNHDTEFVHQAYKGAKISSFDVQRYISCHGHNRGKAKEILAVFV
jgi:DNA adenine methylase